ncbi:RIP metalloprotease RseP [Brevifollis gellanilyticus]|uniref:Zinc metalloprotease n=1 Tax=Brevifollis gellanilyticus TaxID=748831 RepID=A0A512MG89_9BACT|nr:RIP metalloprotease RseP [Brevifollis gellanilyticus]GEP45757.1 zinc metalloprotease [Brevifollis gellanilyticus]
MSWLSSLGPVGEALYFIILIFEVLLVFNLMILVHEWGHFLAARWRGLKVEAFQIWFGKPLWKKTINGVQYGLGCIPAGGFVKLPQMAPMDAIEGESSSTEPLPPISPLDKIIVAFAGPLFSFMLACFFAVFVCWLGKPESEPLVTTTIGYVVKDGPAGKAGLKPGDKILSIDGQPIKRFEGMTTDTVTWNVISSEGKTIQFKVERDGQALAPIDVDPTAWPPEDKKEEKPKTWFQKVFSFIFDRPPLRKIGITGKEVPMIGEVMPHGPADDAGLQVEDELLSVDGQPLLHKAQFSDYIETRADQPIQVIIRRKDKESAASKESTITVTPRLPDKRPTTWTMPLAGFKWHPTGARKLAHPSVWAQVSGSAKALVSMIQKLVTSSSDISPAHMSGPIGIGRVYYNLLQDSEALLQVLWFSVVLNVNLALMNLLPFPVLDGGHIVMGIGEAIRGRPPRGRILEFIQTACVLGLLCFFVFVTLKDTGDILPGGGKNPADEISWLPKDQRTAK